jgi:hypothetical protein
MNPRWMLPLAALLLVLALAATPALACKEDVQHAHARLAELQGKAHTAKPEDRAAVATKLKDAAAELAKADATCAAAKNFVERAKATAEVAAANASMTAAAVYLPGQK